MWMTDWIYNNEQIKGMKINEYTKERKTEKGINLWREKRTKKVGKQAVKQQRKEKEWVDALYS